MRLRLLCFAAALAGIIYIGPAGAMTFDFSFTNAGDPGTTAGTVTGQIAGLSDNEASPATAVIIDSFPNSLGALPAPFNILLYPLITGNPNSIATNSFTVSGGQITAMNFYADGQCLPSPPCGYAPLFLYLVSTSNPAPYIFGASDLLTGVSNGGVQSQSITLTQVSAAPLPPTWTMMLIGLVGFGLSLIADKGKQINMTFRRKRRCWVRCKIPGL